MIKKVKKYFLLAALFAAPPALAYTYDGDELEPLHFGQLVITDNSSIRSCTIPPGGSISCDAEITILNGGQYGIFRISDYDPSVALWAYVDDSATTLENGGSAVFDIKNFTFAPDIGSIGNAALPEGDGSLEIKIGATLKTRAGETYDISPYRGTFTLQINY